jgi:hypothetical protein
VDSTRANTSKNADACTSLDERKVWEIRIKTDAYRGSPHLSGGKWIVVSLSVVGEVEEVADWTSWQLEVRLMMIPLLRAVRVKIDSSQASSQIVKS